MQIVIEISEQIYKQSCVLADIDGSPMLKAIKNGTPLSESEDYVSRKAAIKAICRHCTPEKPERCPTAEIRHSYQELKALPPVTSQPNKWISADVIEKIKAEITEIAVEEVRIEEKWARGLHYAIKVIDKYISPTDAEGSE